MNDKTLSLFAGTISAASTVAQTGKFLGKNRAWNAVARLGGTITAGATLSYTMEESADNATGWTTVPGTGSVTVPQMVGFQSTTPAAAYEVPGTFAIRTPFNNTKDYVRVSTTVGGTTPTITGISIYADPVNNPIVNSGR